ncbi:MAG: hypothetical protein M1820_002935 [Bogoriella megaspora]|nr:MAG: hypothetical protein M1820_002935 [Bogoriella megaspora]
MSALPPDIPETQQPPAPAPDLEPMEPTTNGALADVEMSETVDQTPIDLQPMAEPLPQIASTSTPPATMPQQQPPPRPSSNTPTTPAPITLVPPPAPNPHGSPTRVYLNQNVTPHLLEGMKYLAVYEPEKPLKWLADFLSEKSREIEGA